MKLIIHFSVAFAISAWHTNLNKVPPLSTRGRSILGYYPEESFFSSSNT